MAAEIFNLKLPLLKRTAYVAGVVKTSVSGAPKFLSYNRIAEGAIDDDLEISRHSADIRRLTTDIDPYSILHLTVRLDAITNIIAGAANLSYSLQTIAEQTEEEIAAYASQIQAQITDLVRRAEQINTGLQNVTSSDPDIVIISNVTRALNINGNVAVATDQGDVREKNQDAAIMYKDVAVAVADGMGGAGGGETAAKLALEKVMDYLISGARSQESPEFSKLPALVKAVFIANDEVCREGQRLGKVSPDKKGMGTTLVAVVNDKKQKKIIGVKVGDSRIKALSGGKEYNLGKDHSFFHDFFEKRPDNLVQLPFLIDDATLGPIDLEAKSFEANNVILSCIGGGDNSITMTYFEIPYRESPGARTTIGLYSDGIASGQITENELTALMAAENDPGKLAAKVVDEARKLSQDNSTFGAMVLEGLELEFDKAVHCDYKADTDGNIIRDGQEQVNAPLAKTIIDLNLIDVPGTADAGSGAKMRSSTYTVSVGIGLFKKAKKINITAHYFSSDLPDPIRELIKEQVIDKVAERVSGKDDLHIYLGADILNESKSKDASYYGNLKGFLKKLKQILAGKKADKVTKVFLNIEKNAKGKWDLVVYLNDEVPNDKKQLFNLI